MADNLGPNGLVVSAGKYAGPIPAENRTSCGKSIRAQTNTRSLCYYHARYCQSAFVKNIFSLAMT
jgi:hypothetical protein